MFSKMRASVWDRFLLDKAGNAFLTRSLKRPPTNAYTKGFTQEFAYAMQYAVVCNASVSSFLGKFLSSRCQRLMMCSGNQHTANAMMTARTMRVMRRFWFKKRVCELERVSSQGCICFQRRSSTMV